MATLPGADSATQALQDFIADEKKKTEKELSATEKRSTLNSPSGQLNAKQKQSLADQVWARVKDGPLLQLGQDFIAEQIARNGQLILANIDSQTEKLTKPLVQTVTQVKDTVFNTITTAMTLQNDLVMFFLQSLAKETVQQMNTKLQIAQILKDKIQQLYNAVAQVVAADPFFSKYLIQLRQALIHIDTAYKDLLSVHNTLAVNNVFLERRFAEAQQELEDALKLMEPKSAKFPDKKINDSKTGLLTNVGIPSQPQQLMLILAIPQLSKEVLAAASGYFMATIKVNALLLAFIQGYDEFTQSTSPMTKNFSTETIKKTMNMLGDVIADMATRLNGSATSIYGPNTGFKPDEIKVSSWSMDWTLKLHAAIALLKAVPGTALKKVQASNEFLSAYNKACELIKLKDNRTEGGAVLTATDGREEFGQLERQLSVFVLGSLAAIVDSKNAQSILAVGRALIKRMELTEIQDTEIISILNAFISSDVGVTDNLKKTGAQIQSLLKRLGLDRAADLLSQGKFAEFFGLNAKTATYVGAAIMAISKLKSCLGTREDQSILDAAQVEMERAQKAKELMARRSISTSLSIQEKQATQREQQLISLENQVSQVGSQLKQDSKCSLPDDFMPANLLKNLGPVLGVGLFGGGTIGKQFQKLGKGII